MQEFEALKGQFEEMDKDGKGALTREEFGKALGLLSSDEVNQSTRWLLRCTRMPVIAARREQVVAHAH